MSLLDRYARECTILVPVMTDDGEGGRKTEWTDGETFTNHQALDTSMEARRAEKEGVNSLFSALVEQSVQIAYGDYFRDNASGVTYRVTSNPDEKYSPSSASFHLKYFTAERKEPPA